MKPGETFGTFITNAGLVAAGITVITLIGFLLLTGISTAYDRLTAPHPWPGTQYSVRIPKDKP